MALALARKYRPRNFASVAVQSHVSETLKGAISRGRVAHGYLLCGPRGTGKTTLARVLAMALNCERRAERDDGEPCGECDSCLRIWSGSASLDVVEIDAASNRGVDDARELRERAMYAPSADDRYKVYIVDEAHMLTREAWNALLKVLEEPPPRVVFVFATTDPQKIAQAAAPVLSRLQRFDLRRIGPAEIRDRLTQVLAAEGVAAEPEALAMIARAADGGLRDALSLTDQVLSLGTDSAVTADRVRDALGLVPEEEFLSLLDMIVERRPGDLFGAVARLADAGVDLAAFFGGLAGILRAQLAVVLGGSTGDISEKLRGELEERRARLPAADLLRMLNAVAAMEPSFRRSGQQQLLLEMLLVRLALMDRSVELEAVLRELGTGDGVGTGMRGAASSGDRETGPVGRSASSGAVSAAAPSRTGSSPGRSRPRGSAPAQEPTWEGPRPWEGEEQSAAVAKTVEPPRRTVHVAAGAADGPIPDLNLLVERWGEVVEQLRADSRGMVAAFLVGAPPIAVTAGGVVTLEMEDEAALRGVEANTDQILESARRLFPALTKVRVRGGPSGLAPRPQRLTAESIRDERVSQLRQRDPLLAEAMDALDLELLD